MTYVHSTASQQNSQLILTEKYFPGLSRKHRHHICRDFCGIRIPYPALCINTYIQRCLHYIYAYRQDIIEPLEFSYKLSICLQLGSSPFVRSKSILRTAYKIISIKPPTKAKALLCQMICAKISNTVSPIRFTTVKYPRNFPILALCQPI